MTMSFTEAALSPASSPFGALSKLVVLKRDVQQNSQR